MTNLKSYADLAKFHLAEAMVRHAIEKAYGQDEKKLKYFTKEVLSCLKAYRNEGGKGLGTWTTEEAMTFIMNETKEGPTYD